MPSSTTLRGAGELIAAIPQLLGFEPEESVVLVAIRNDGVVSTVLRASRSDCLDPRVSAELGRGAAQHLERAGARLVIAVSFTAHSVALECPAIEALRPALAMVADSVEAWACTAGRYFAPGCARLSCCPEGGRILPQIGDLTGETGVTAVTHGAPRLGTPHGGNVTEPQRRNCARACDRWWAHRSEGESWRRRSLKRWLAALSDAENGILPSEAEAGKLIAALRDQRVRDAALVSLVPGARATADRLVADGTTKDAAPALDIILNADRGRAPDPRVCEALWRLADWLTALSRQAQRAPVLALCALMAWWEGDSREAADLADAALGVDPGYRLAQLLRCTLIAGISPGWLRAA